MLRSCSNEEEAFEISNGNDYEGFIGRKDEGQGPEEVQGLRYPERAQQGAQPIYLQEMLP